MPQKALSMRKIKEVLRLRYDLGLLQNEIARSCSISQSSVNRYLERASAAGLSWPLPEDCDDRRLNELLFPTPPAGGSPAARAPLDCAALHHQLQSHKHVTLQLLWEEYRQSQPEGYRYPGDRLHACGVDDVDGSVSSSPTNLRAYGADDDKAHPAISVLYSVREL